MRYIIMCGGHYEQWEIPKQLTEIKGEPIAARTIRLLQEAGAKDIAISSDNDVFEQLGVPVLRHKNDFVCRRYNDYDGYWCDGFFPMEEPTCYLFGDVVFSPEAIDRIMDTETKDIDFFASSPPFAPEYPKPHIEPFGFKVVNTKHLRQAIDDVKRLDRAGRFERKPIAWELWNVISRGTEGGVNTIMPGSYIRINDYTCDIDSPDEKNLIRQLERYI